MRYSFVVHCKGERLIIIDGYRDSIVSFPYLVYQKSQFHRYEISIRPEGLYIGPS